MKLVVVGGVAGGASAAARVKRLDPTSEVVIFERGEHVSFSNCCLPYHLSGTVADAESLLLMDPVKFKNLHDIDARINTEVTAIDRAKKKVSVKNLATGEEYEESYDKLVLAPGANPIMPKSIKGIDRENVFAIRNVTDIKKLKAYIDRPEVKDVVVVGGGFIGIEAAENLAMAGKTVRLIEGLNQILAPFDYDMVQILHKEMYDKGVELHLSSTLTAIEEGHVVATKDDQAFEVPADVVIMSIGVAPETKLAVEAGIEIGATRGIKVNHNYQTNDPDIYAVGDAVEIFNALTHKYGRLALAGPAQRQAHAAADHMFGIHHNNRGYIGSSCLKVFDMNAASTGLNAKAAAAAGYNFETVELFPQDKVALMPNSNYMAFKLVFEVPTGRILGAQAIGKGAVDKRVDVIATMITMGADLEDLKELELCYSPVYSTAKDVVNMAAFVGLNVLYGRLKQVHAPQVRELIESGAYIIDVREEAEYAAGHLKGSHNIPLSQLRNRMDEIPKEGPVYLHCRSGQRSYYAIKYLAGIENKELYNIAGSYLAMSYYEYFNDKTTGREPIIEYNFA